MNYLTSVVQLMNICESELLFDTLPIAKTQRQYVKRVWMKNSIVEERVIIKYNRIEYLVNNERHRVDGPAILYANGVNEWCVNGKNHRVDGPAIDSPNCKKWCINNKYHRVNGPAIDSLNNKQWYINDKCHRVDGPAQEYYGDKDWWINDEWQNNGAGNAGIYFLAITGLLIYWYVKK